VKAIIVVHLYGNFADLPALLPIATRFGVPVVEDCAQAHGARLGESFAGSLGAVGTFSFYPTKNLGAMGDGGMVVARDPDLAYKVRALREYGWQRRYISEAPGVNSRLDELQAAILRVRLTYLDAANTRRAAIAAAYDHALADSGLILPSRRTGVTHVYHQYVVRHPQRDRLQSGLNEKRVGTNIHYPVPVHRQPAYAGRIEMDPDGLVATDAIATEILSLPMYPELSDAAVEEIAHSIRSLV
jgi:dTDP-4-amino-4,6-dideoxygalactose transaminase